QAISFAQANQAMGTNKMAEGFAATLPSFATHFGRAVATDARSHPMKYGTDLNPLAVVFARMIVRFEAIGDGSAAAARRKAEVYSSWRTGMQQSHDEAVSDLWSALQTIVTVWKSNDSQMEIV
ncbi:MAG TPA: hypothetical protein VEK84_18225, partial [Terriglobales bacterium]|nr:hypothetical protein [Terriglobales bacterium]